MTAETSDPHVIHAAAEKDLVTVRVWRVPIRVIHWMIFLATIVLSVTGFYIGRPFIALGSDAAFVMGWMRAIHQLSAWIFVAALGARMVLMFTGNRYARWTQFIPVDEHRRLEGRETLKYYLFLRQKPMQYAGHNPLAGLTYTVVYVMLFVQVVTGFALRDVAAPSWLFDIFGGWMLTFADAQLVRFIHHLIMWLTWGFVVHHVYSAMLMDWEERSGIISSMVSGRKRVRKDRV
jgi:Ni/Fe-hydrogenase 1 B-type cytochrome subunit